MNRRHVFTFSVTLISFASAPALAQPALKIACVGDFHTGPNVQSVAGMIASWAPDAVVTVGDNNYTANDATVASWDNEVGQYYGQFIRYPAGSSSVYAPGPPANKFFPALGNHDWDAGIGGWYNYFELPGNERYYDVVKGPVHLFFIDSDGREYDGNTSSSVQGQWLQQRLAASASPWKIVLFHHSPYSSSSGHGNTPNMQWPFSDWGATLVFSGHDHSYERIVKNGFNYIVNGIGGMPLYEFRPTPEPGSVVRYNASHGAVLLSATTLLLVVRSYSTSGVLFDSLRIFDSTVPVQLSNFSGTYVAQSRVHLAWTTLSETRNYGFEVQRRENRHSTFLTLPTGFVPGHGTTLLSHRYFFNDNNAITSSSEYRLKIIDLDGGVEFSEGIVVNAPTSSIDVPQPTGFRLDQNFPNPFNPVTTIRFSVGTYGHTSLRVFDGLGQEVMLLLDGNQDAGEHSVQVNTQRLASGVYYYRLIAGEHSATRQFTVLK